VLTDGRRLYFADLGLALCSRFDLSVSELAFFRRHTNYDRCYTVTHLTHWLVSNLLKIPWASAQDYIRENLDGNGYTDLPASAAAIVARHSPVAAIMGQFFTDLQTVSKSTTYPAESLRRALRP
jgi:hypothetical protein